MRAEEKLLALFLRRSGSALPPYDDVAAMELGDEYLVLNVDGFTAKSVMLHFMDLKDVGWRAVTAALSDLIAKLTKPLGISFSVYGPKFEVVKELSEGIREAMEFYDLRFYGADTNRGEAAVDVFAFGFSPEVPPPVDGARPGDLVVVGEACWGCINACLKGVELEECKRPKVKFDALRKVERKCVTASSDSSDGLLMTLYKIAKYSKVKIVLERLPSNPLGLGEEEVLVGGEEYAPVMTVKPSCSVPEGFEVIGRVEEGEGVFWKGELLEPKGWEWF